MFPWVNRVSGWPSRNIPHSARRYFWRKRKNCFQFLYSFSSSASELLEPILTSFIKLHLHANARALIGHDVMTLWCSQWKLCGWLNTAILDRQTQPTPNPKMELVFRNWATLVGGVFLPLPCMIPGTAYRDIIHSVRCSFLIFYLLGYSEVAANERRSFL